MRGERYYIFFDRLHVDTKEPLEDYYCWTFDDPVLFNAEVERLKKMDHIKVISHGMAIEKTPTPAIPSVL